VSDALRMHRCFATEYKSLNNCFDFEQVCGSVNRYDLWSFTTRVCGFHVKRRTKTHKDTTTFCHGSEAS
jgi:hypothetical protein